MGLLLKTTAHKGPATIAKQFASHLKDIKPYDDWTDAEILHQFSSWSSHAKGPAAADAAAADAAAEAAAEPEAEEADASEDGFASAQSETEAPAPAAPAPVPEPKKKQTKAAKAAAAINTAIPPVVAYVPPPVAKAPPSTAETLLTNALLAAAPAAPAAPAAFKPKAVKSKAAAPTYTAEQLSNFTEFEHNGQTYGRNERGDLVDTESNFVGRWNGKAIETIPEPADWTMCVL